MTNLISAPATSAAAAEDMIVDMRGVSVVRDGKHILHPMDWQVELDERWIIIGPNGAGKTTLMRMASAQMFPTTGTVTLVGEQMGKVDLREIRTSIGMSSSALAHRIPADELVKDCRREHGTEEMREGAPAPDDAHPDILVAERARAQVREMAGIVDA